MIKLYAILIVCLLFIALGYNQYTNISIIDPYVQEIKQTPTTSTKTVEEQHSTKSSQNTNSKENELRLAMFFKDPNAISPSREFNLSLTNNSMVNYRTDTHYTIEYFDGSVWVEIPLIFFVGDVGVNIFPEETVELKIYLYPEQHQYLPGKYRISKTVSTSEESFKITAVFFIK